MPRSVYFDSCRVWHSLKVINVTRWQLIHLHMDIICRNLCTQSDGPLYLNIYKQLRITYPDKLKLVCRNLVSVARDCLFLNVHSLGQVRSVYTSQGSPKG